MVPSDVQSIGRQARRTGEQSHMTKLMSLYPNFRMRLEVDFNTRGERVCAVCVVTGWGAVVHAVMNLCV